MNAGYEAGVEGARFYRLQQTRDGLRRYHPDLDLSGFTPEGLFPNKSSDDIDALDEAAFQAKIDEWKRANGLETEAVEKKKKSNAQTVEKNRADRKAFGGSVKFKLAPKCTTLISKHEKAPELRQHLSGYGYATSAKSAKKYRKGNKFGEPCQTCVKFIRDLYNGTACVPCDQFYVPRANDVIKAARDVQNDYNIDFGVTIDLDAFKNKSKKRKKSASKPQGAKKAKTAAPAE